MTGASRHRLLQPQQPDRGAPARSGRRCGGRCRVYCRQVEAVAVAARGALRRALLSPGQCRGRRPAGLIVDRFADTVVVQITHRRDGSRCSSRCSPRSTGRWRPRKSSCGPTPRYAPWKGLQSYVRAGEAGRIAVEENGVRYFADMASARRPAGITISATTAPSSHPYRAANRCSTPIAIAAGSPWPPRAPVRRRQPGSTVPRRHWRWPRTPPPRTACSCNFVKADVFEELETAMAAREKFDVVVADPPPFVKARGSRSGRQGLSQAGAAGRVRRRTGRAAAAGVLLAQYFARTFRAGMRRGYRAGGRAAR